MNSPKTNESDASLRWFQSSRRFLLDAAKSRTTERRRRVWARKGRDAGSSQEAALKEEEKLSVNRHGRQGCHEEEKGNYLEIRFKQIEDKVPVAAELILS
jgi:hypothetical protein